jgi:hypothetical protein
MNSDHPENIIINSRRRLETKNRDILIRIDYLIHQSTFLGGKLRFKLENAFIDEVLSDLNIIYKIRGWQDVNIFNEHSENRVQTVIELTYNFNKV